MMIHRPSLITASIALLWTSTTSAFQALEPRNTATSTTALAAMDRRQVLTTAAGGIFAAGAGLLGNPTPSNAEVFLDPAMYGDQELRVSAVDSIKEQVRRAILQKPVLAPSFYQLSLLDGLSYNEKTKKFGPDGSIVKAVLSAKAEDEYTKNLQEAVKVLIDGAKTLKRKNAITIADAVAIGGSEAIESIGGPVLAVQLGRTEPDKNAPISPLPIDLFSGKKSNAEVVDAFKQAGLTEREMTALLAGLFTLEMVEKSRSAEDWRESAKPKFRERGKMGRMSEFKKLTEEDIAAAEASEFDDDDDEPSLFDDSNVYIADSFGTREERFGKRVGAEDINEKSFNKYLKELDDATNKKKGGADLSAYGWIGLLFADKGNPTVQTWVKKYAGSNLNYLKDLKGSFNSITQLGAVYTGGKYENLLKNKPRKSLGDDLDIF